MISANWSLLHKILFRFFAAYFGLFALCGMIFVGDGSPLDKCWNWPVTLAGRWLINRNFKIEVWPNGSGDTTFNYLQIVAMLILSLMICIIWTIADGKKSNYEKLQYWLTVFLRYTMAITMLTYGMAKIAQAQFPYPQLFQLDQRLGDSSPMGLAWIYMGYSRGYNLFTGGIEFLAGLLLFFRRTQLSGALLCIAVMANVVALNFFYDIPVKIFSTHLLLIACAIALPDMPRLIRFFFGNQAVSPTISWRPQYARKRQRFAYLAIKIVLISFILYYKIFSFIPIQQELARTTRPPLYGMYDIQTTLILPDTIPLFNNWKKIYIEQNGMLIARDSNGELLAYYLATDTLHHALSIWSSAADSVCLHYQHPETGLLLLNGYIGADSVSLCLKRKDPGEYLLNNRGFHWINEQPFNR